MLSPRFSPVSTKLKQLSSYFTKILSNMLQSSFPSAHDCSNNPNPGTGLVPGSRFPPNTKIKGFLATKPYYSSQEHVPAAVFLGIVPIDMGQNSPLIIAEQFYKAELHTHTSQELFAPSQLFTVVPFQITSNLTFLHLLNFHKTLPSTQIYSLLTFKKIMDFSTKEYFDAFAPSSFLGFFLISV